MNKRINMFKMTAFMIVFLMVFTVLNVVFQPMWRDWNNYNTTHGFYEQPKNTIETVFVGTSSVVNGISPMEIYDDYGICSYNLGTEQQPIMTSYYWVKEAYRLHSDTLKTVVLDVSGLIRKPDDAYYHKALDSMKFSTVKYDAVMAHVDDFWDGLEYLTPLMAYHERWDSLSKEDFAKFGFDPESDVRGYNFTHKLYLDSTTYDKLYMLDYVYDKSADATMLSSDNFFYFDEIVKFCDKNEINLILVKIPSHNWTSSGHMSAQSIADYYDLDFIDFNYEPYIDEMNINSATDFIDSWHLNYHGANKVSEWLGNYLITECDGTDVRGNDKYAFMEEQLKTYKRKIIAAELDNIGDPCEYIGRIINEEDYTVFVTVKDDASKALTEDQRAAFREIGLSDLADLGYRNSYIAVIEDGMVIYEERETPVSVNGSSSEKKIDSENITIDAIVETKVEKEDVTKDEDDGDPTISNTGYLKNKTFYKIISGGRYLGNKASCKIDDVEYAANSRGLNIVIYDNIRNRVADAVVFDTNATPEREMLPMTALADYQQGKIDYNLLSDRAKKLYLYNARCENTHMKKRAQLNLTDDGMLNYLKVFWNNENYTIFMSVKDEAAKSLSDEARNAMKEMGLTKMAGIGYRDSYACVVQGGNVLQELNTFGTESVNLKSEVYELVSCGYSAGNYSSIKISDKEYSPNKRGVNIVIYDNRLNVVVDTATFDTYENGVRVNE